jgi:hypothetical protein
METLSTREFRKRFVEIGLRRAKAGTGSSREILERRTAVMKASESVLKNVLQVAADYLSESVEDLKSLIQLGKLERRQA